MRSLVFALTLLLVVPHVATLAATESATVRRGRQATIDRLVQRPNQLQSAEDLTQRRVLVELPIDADQQPIAVPTPEQQDRLRSLAWFSQARLFQQREQYAEALRAYQRAYQWNPESAAALHEITPLAFFLERPAVASRYAVLLVQRDIENLDLTRSVILYLSDREDYERAIPLYRRYREASWKSSARNAAFIVEQWELGRLCFFAGEYQLAGDALALVDDALQKPAEFQLDAATRGQILAKPDIAYGLMGEAFLNSERLDRAARLFEQAHAADANGPILAFRHAQIAARRKQWEIAREELNRYFAADIRDAGEQPFELLREILRGQHGDDGLDDRLLAELNAIQKSDEKNLPLQYFLADRYEEKKDFELALANYRQAMEQVPTLDGFRGLLANGRELSRVEMVAQTLGQVMASVGDLSVVSEQQQAILQDGPFLAKLLEWGKEQREQQPPQLMPPTALALGLLAIADKQLETADAFFDFAMAANAPQTFEWKLTVGLAYFMEDQYAQAANWLRQLLDDPAIGERREGITLYLSTALAADKQFAEALRLVQTARENSPMSVMLQSRLAWLHYRNNETEKADTLYRKLIDEQSDRYDDPSDRELLKEAKLQLSNLCLDRNDSKAAEEWLQQVLDEYPEDVGAMNDLGYLWADADQHLNRAYRMIAYAVENEPENQAYRDSLGWVLFRLGKYAEAVRELEQAAAGQEPDGIILEHLGDAYWSLQQADAARQTWQRAVKAYRAVDETAKATALETKVAAANGENNNSETNNH